MPDDRREIIDELVRHTDFARRLARSILRDDALAADAVQDALVEGWRKRWSSRDNLRGWLARAVRSHSLMRLRAAKRRQRHEAAAPAGSAAGSADEFVAREELRRTLAAGVAGLDEPLREALRLRFYDGLTLPEIARRQGISKQAAADRVRRGVELVGRRTGVRRDDARWGAILAGLAADGIPVAGLARLRGWTVVAAGLLAGVVVVATAWGVRKDGVRARSSAGSSQRAPDVRAPARPDPDPDQDRDDDPNRIPGPPLVVRGVVRHRGRPRAGVSVRAFCAYDRPEEPRAVPAAPVAAATTDGRGRFRLAVSRRTRLSVEARTPGLAPSAALVVAPVAGNPDEVIVDLVRPFPTLGRVVAAGDGRPIAGAQVRVRQGAGYATVVEVTVVTGADGSFRVPLQQPTERNPLSLEVRRPGYAPLLVSAVRPLFVGEGVADVGVLRLGRGCSAQGFVRTVDGKPVPGARVRVGVRAGPDAVQTGTALVADDGRYRILDLPAEPIVSFSVAPPLGSPLAIFEQEGGRGVMLRHGRPHRRDVTLRRGAALVVRAVRPNGSPLPAARIELYRSDGPIRRLVQRGRTDERGRARFTSLPDGEYGVEATTAGWACFVRKRLAHPVISKIDFVVRDGHGPGEFAAVLRPSGAVQVRLGFPPGVRSPAGPAGHQQLAWVGLESGGANFEAVGSPGGLATFPCVKQASDAFVFGPGGDPVVPLDIRAGQLVEVALRSQPFVLDVDVTVIDERGGPVADAAVLAVATGSFRSALRTLEERYRLPWNVARTDRNGRARLRYAGAAADDLSLAWSVAAAKPGRVSAHLRMTDAPRGSRSVRITLGRGAEIRGRVIGAGRSRIYIHLRRLDGGGRPAWRIGTLAHARGVFRLRGLSPGRYRLAASRDGQPDPGVVVAAEAGDRGVRLLLPAPVESVAGVLIDDAGRPLPGGAIELTSSTDGRRFRAFADESGSWQLRVRPGAYRLRAEPGTGDVHFAPVDWGVIDAERRKRLRVEARLPAPWTGVVVDRNGHPVPGALVVALRPRPTRAGPPEGSAAPHVWTAGDGVFRLPVLRDAFTDLLVVARGHCPLVRPRPSSNGAQRLVLEAGGEIAGRLFEPDGSPARFVRLSVRPGPAQQRAVWSWEARVGTLATRLWACLDRATTTDAEGGFRFRGLPAGRYSIGMLIKSRVSSALPPHACNTGSRDLELRMRPMRTISGRLDLSGVGTRPHRRAFARWSVRAYFEGTECARVFVRPDGTYRLSVPRVPLKLRLAAPGMRPTSVDVSASGSPAPLPVLRDRPRRAD